MITDTPVSSVRMITDTPFCDRDHARVTGAAWISEHMIMLASLGPPGFPGPCSCSRHWSRLDFRARARVRVSCPFLFSMFNLFNLFMCWAVMILLCEVWVEPRGGGARDLCIHPSRAHGPAMP